jgi:hypothetical protein
MKTLQNITLTVRKENNGNIFVHLRADTESEYGSISFLFDSKQWDEFGESHYQKEFIDLSHRLYVTGDLCMFYNFEIPSQTTGTMSISYIQVNIPRFVRKVLRVYVRKVVENLEKDLYGDFESKTIELDIERVFRWYRLYGVSKGSLKLIASEETKVQLEKDLETESFRNRFEQLKKIALNRTDTFFSKGKLYLNFNKTWGEYNFSVAGLSGGVINHNKSGEADWSIHT